MRKAIVAALLLTACGGTDESATAIDSTMTECATDGPSDVASWDVLEDGSVICPGATSCHSWADADGFRMAFCKWSCSTYTTRMGETCKGSAIDIQVVDPGTGTWEWNGDQCEPCQ